METTDADGVNAPIIVATDSAAVHPYPKEPSQGVCTRIYILYLYLRLVD
jgi:hypothetical protein